MLMATLHVIAGATENPAHPVVRRIGISDLIDALRRGLDDFNAMPSHAIFLCLIYPVVGFFIGGLMLGYNLLPLLFPASAGFALIGPFAALGLYELSKRREAGLDIQWRHAFDVLHSPSIGAIAAIGFLLMCLFLAWLAVAQWIYQSLFGVLPPESVTQFAHEVLTTSAGWKLIFYGNAAGLVFAIAALAVSVVSFPLLLDRDVGAAVAIMTSLRAVAANPVPMAAWGLIVAALLVIGSLPFFTGLAVIMPVLGHATWHLYRKVIER
jgi:uncharacterized membrane protein